MNRRGELGSPCLRPISELKNCEWDDWYFMQDLITEYIEDIALTSLLQTLSEVNFCHNKVRSPQRHNKVFRLHVEF